MPRESPLDKQRSVSSSQYSSEQFQRLIGRQRRRLFDEPFELDPIRGTTGRWI